MKKNIFIGTLILVAIIVIYIYTKDFATTFLLSSPLGAVVGSKVLKGKKGIKRGLVTK